MAEPGSSNEPPRKKPRNEPRKVKILFKAPGRQSCEIWVYEFWLSSSEFFEAKFDRWSSSGQEVEPIVLELPAACKPEKGAQSFKKRLLAVEIEEEVDWGTVQWWRSVGGDDETLFAALCIFDLVLMQQYCKEVAETLHVFQVECPLQIGSVAVKYKEGVRCLDETPSALAASGPIEAVPPGEFAEYSKLFCRGDLSSKPIMDRAIAGCLPDDEQAYCRVLLVLLFHSGGNQEIKWWIQQHLNTFVSRTPRLVGECLEQMFKFKHRTRLEVQEVLVAFATDFLHLLFKESAREQIDEIRHREVVAGIDLITQLVSQDFEKRDDHFSGVSEKFRSAITMPVFAVASASAQRSLMRALGKDVGVFFRDQAHLVHPGHRRMLLPYIGDLSAADRDCLATTPFRRQKSILV